MDDRVTYDEALAELDKVAADIASRDKVIRRAHRAHVPNAEIARRLGIGRPTVIKVIRDGTEDQP